MTLTRRLLIATLSLTLTAGGAYQPPVACSASVPIV